MEPGKTTIQISAKLWKYLNDLKSKPNESFEEVLIRIMNNKSQQEVKK